MFRYKSVKHKSNYLCVKIPFNVNGFAQTEYTLVLPLFGGEHSVSTRFEVGNGYTGEAVFHYAYDKGVIKVCGYDWDKKDEIPYEVPPHYTRPHLNLYRADSNSQEPALTVSSDNSTALRCNTNDSFLLNTVEPIKANLRTVYNYVQEAVKKTGVNLQTHVDDIVERDEEGNIVGGTAVSIKQNWTGYFYNIEGSSTKGGDHPQTGGSWIKYYCKHANNVPNGYCASKGNGIKCTDPKNPDWTPFGGHIHTYSSILGTPHTATGIPMPYNGCEQYYCSGLSRREHKMPKTAKISGNHKYNQSTIYYMLPICAQHNNTGNYDVVMRNNNKEVLLCLHCFKHNVKW